MALTVAQIDAAILAVNTAGQSYVIGDREFRVSERIQNNRRAIGRRCDKCQAQWTEAE